MITEFNKYKINESLEYNDMLSKTINMLDNYELYNKNWIIFEIDHSLKEFFKFVDLDVYEYLVEYLSDYKVEYCIRFNRYYYEDEQFQPSGYKTIYKDLKLTKPYITKEDNTDFLYVPNEIFYRVCNNNLTFAEIFLGFDYIEVFSTVSGSGHFIKILNQMSTYLDIIEQVYSSSCIFSTKIKF